MLRLPLIAAGLALGFSAVLAQANPIAERRDTMKGVGAATREAAALAKGETPFDAAKAQAIFKVYVEAARKMPALYPEDSKSGGDTTAAPKVWEDAAGFKAAFAKFEAEAAAAAAAATDQAAFRTAFGGVSRNCGACHEVYRVKR